MRKFSLYLVLFLFVCVVMVLFLNSSSCYALSYQNIIDYVNQTTDYYSGNSRYPNIKLNLTQPAIQTKIMEICEDYGGMYVYYDSAGYVYWKFYNDNDGIITGGPNALYYQGNYAIITGIPTTNVVYNFTTGNTGAYVDTMDQCFRTTANKYNELRGMNFTNYQIVDSEPLTYVGQAGYSPLSKLVFNNAVENTAYNGSTYTYYYQGDFYSNNQIYLGYIVPNDSYYFEIRLKDSNTNVIKGNCFVSLNTEPYNFYSDGAISINKNYEINAIPRLLDYSTQYQLEITSYYGEGGTDLDEDIDWFIFLPQNAVVSGDNIQSLGSGDFTNQDSANNVIGSMETQTQHIINALTDFTPLSSGDIINNVEVIPIIGYGSGDSINNFFVDILKNISEVFLLDDEVTLQVELPIFSRVISIRSDFWITRNYLPRLADFIEGAWWILICMAIVYKVDVLVELYNFGDFINAANQIYQTRRLL